MDLNPFLSSLVLDLHSEYSDTAPIRIQVFLLQFLQFFSHFFLMIRRAMVSLANSLMRSKMRKSNLFQLFMWYFKPRNPEIIQNSQP
jgi:hypothetical protein